MKSNKFFGLLCAICMLLSLMVPATATGLPEEARLSAYAGDEAACRVMVVSADGTETRTYNVDVSIPAGATKAQESALIQAAVASARSNPTRGSEATIDTLYRKTNFTIYSSDDYKIGSVTIPNPDYISYLAVFELGSINNGAGELTVTVTSDKSPGKSNVMSVDLDRFDVFVMMYDGDGRVFLPKDSKMTVTATVDRGNIRVDSCELWASIFDLG